MKTLILCLLSLFLFFQIGLAQNRLDNNSRVQSNAQDWETRARQTADDPKGARKVIIDALSAGKLKNLALAYERLFQADQKNDIRLGNYVHAAMLSEKFRATNDNTYKPCFDRAVKMLASAIDPEADRINRIHESHLSHNMSDVEYYKPMRNKTRNADVWLAWGIHASRSIGHEETISAFKKALELDPTLAEADMWLAELAFSPYNRNYFNKHKEESYLFAEKAEKANPQLHPRISYIRAYLLLGPHPTRTALSSARKLLYEYVTAWPDCSDSKALQKLIARLDADLANPQFK